MRKWQKMLEGAKPVFSRLVGKILLPSVIIWLLWQPIGRTVLVAQAATTDSGAITITGIVPPAATSVTTQIQTNAEPTVSQNSDLTYTVNYTAHGTTTLPVTLQAKWDKGLIAGASEPSVDLLEYVIGSASLGFGDTLPIVDTHNHTITWTMPAVPADGQTHSVTFKLRTTNSYTGSREVALTVKALTLSPVGVPDRAVTRQYLYQSTPEPTVSITATPTAPALAATTSATVGTVVPESIQAPLNQFQTIAVQSLGAVSARLLAQTQQPAGLVLKYGATPTTLTSKIFQPANPANTLQQFTLTGLQPSTRYYYQIATTSAPTLTSDIFTFETASQLADQSVSAPIGVTLTQDRTIIYTGQSTLSNREVTQPVVVTKDSVIDVSLNLPKHQPIKTVEALIRSFSVLGASTESFTADELQSTTTQMTPISPETYVGKLRAPVSAGTYQIISRVEDTYGNIVEQEIGSMQVVAPFTITDAKTTQPLEHAQITLEMFNDKSGLYQRLSNVTTTIRNPIFSDINGVVTLSLFPGKYQAVVELPGYMTQRVAFEVGTNPSGMPQVALQPTGTVWSGQALYTLGMISHVWTAQAELFTTLAKSQRMFQLMLLLALMLLGLGIGVSLLLRQLPQLNPLSWLHYPYRQLWQRVIVLISYGLIRTISFCGELFIALSLIFSYLFYRQLGHPQGLWLLLVTGTSMGLWSLASMLLGGHQNPPKKT